MANRLQHATSPYLLQHADNPVDWYEWGEDALAQAREQDKPIFLSIGYAACHWCHVMAHESFENEAIAAVMNEHFINIKVDREERPDIDSIYMDAVVAMTGQGGWPMSVFLTPAAAPFYGGTYFPPSRRLNLPGFQELLLEIARLWHADRPQLLTSAEQMADHLRRAHRLPETKADPQPSMLRAAAERMHEQYDWTHGGWGRAPKFPQATSIDFLLDRFVLEGDKLARDMALGSLRSMANGGIYDQLGGGFSRYAVDADWQVPHFEKMLYDNALLLASFLKAWQVSSESSYLQIANETLDFLLRELRHEGGGFFSSLDADSEGEEGKFYRWTAAEAARALEGQDQAEMALEFLGLRDGPNFEGAYVLRRARSTEQLAQEYGLSPERVAQCIKEAKAILFERRAERVHPGLDDKILAGWNGMLLQSLALGAQATGESRWLEPAQALARFLLDEMVVDGRLMRSWRAGRARFPAYLEDQAALGLGLLELYQADFDVRWFQAALARARVILERYKDPVGGFFETADDHETLLTRPKSAQDTPTPSGSSMAVQLLLELFSLDGDPELATEAERAMAPILDHARSHPTAFAGWLQAISFRLGASPQLAVVGGPDDPGFDELVQIAQRPHRPHLVIAAGRQPGAGPTLLEGRTMVEGKATAFLCQSFACRLPTTDPNELSRQLDELRG